MLFYLGGLLISPAICGYSSLGFDILPTCLLSKDSKKDAGPEQPKSPCMPCCSFQCHCDIMVLTTIPGNAIKKTAKNKIIFTDDIVNSLFSNSNWQPPEMI